MNNSKITLEMTQLDDVLLEALSAFANEYDIELVICEENEPNVEERIAAEESGARAAATVNTGGGYLNLRKAKDPASESLAQIPNGTAINVVRSSSAWFTLVYNGIVGFVQNQYVSGASSLAIGQGIVTGNYAKVNSNNVTVRSGPGTGFEGLYMKNRGNVVMTYGAYVTSDGYWWYRISPTTSNAEWMRGDFLAPNY